MYLLKSSLVETLDMIVVVGVILFVALIIYSFRDKEKSGSFGFFKAIIAAIILMFVLGGLSIGCEKLGCNRDCEEWCDCHPCK